MQQVAPSPPPLRRRLGPRARRRRARRPVRRLRAQDEVHGAALCEDVVPRDPRLVPVLAVDAQALDVVAVVALVAAAGGRDAQRLAGAAEVEGEVREPRAADEEGGLARHGVQAEHDPQQPGLHGAGVRVARQAGLAEGVVGLGEAARVLDGEVLPADEAEEVRGREGGLVARVEDHAVEGARGVGARREHHLEARGEGRLPARVGDERVDVVVGVEGVLPGKRFVVWWVYGWSAFSFLLSFSNPFPSFFSHRRVLKGTTQ